MNKSRFYALVWLTLCITPVFIACGDDDDNESKQPVKPVDSTVIKDSINNDTTAVKDSVDYDTTAVVWLGKSIYDGLQNSVKVNLNGTFSVYLRLINDLGYTESFSRTGSFTIFPANDEAYARFFSNNSWGVRCYEDLSLGQKKMLLLSSVLNKACLIDNLSEGSMLRLPTMLNVTDSITFLPAYMLPDTPAWKKLKEKGTGIYCVNGSQQFMMPFFTQKQMALKGITKEDVYFIMNNKIWEDSIAIVMQTPIIQKDVLCTNGYIDQVADVIVPLRDMAEVIRSNPQTSIFSRLLERFSVPYPDEQTTRSYNNYASQNGLPLIDMIYSWQYEGIDYFNDNDGKNMGAMFVPSDEAMSEFFIGAGIALKANYGTWDNVPNDVLVPFINNLIKHTFVESLPSKFASILNDAKEPMGVRKEDVCSVKIANNGVIYETNRVYAPAVLKQLLGL